MAEISRRLLLRRFAALALGAIGSNTLAGCSLLATPTRPATTDAVATSPTSEATLPTATLAPTPSPTFAPPPPKPEIIRFHPDVPSAVVHARHAGVWQGDSLVPGALRQMLDASIIALTGLADARTAWAALFRPEERIAIKVNAFQNSLVWTHVPLVAALTDCLQDAGVAAEQIVIYDNLSRELKTAGFAVSQHGPGVRCYGSDFRHTAGFTVAGKPVVLSNVLLGCHALINVPILKVHGMSGISFALKNHYGTVSAPADLHNPLNRAIAELNALPEIRDRTRLVIGDALGICLKGEGSWPYWREEKPGDSLFVGYDPVAVDTLGLGLFCQALLADAGTTGIAEVKAGGWLAAAAKLGIGTNDEKNMQVTGLALG